MSSAQYSFISYYDNSASTCPFDAPTVYDIASPTMCQALLGQGCSYDNSSGLYFQGHGCSSQLNDIPLPSLYSKFRIIFSTYNDSRCSDSGRTTWYALPPNTQFNNTFGSFVTQQTSSTDCSVTKSSIIVGSNDGCVNLYPSTNTNFGKIISCPSTTTRPSPVTWSGSYKIDVACSLSVCGCCMNGTITVQQSGLAITINVPVTGQCNGVTVLSGTGSLVSVLADRVYITMGSISYYVARDIDRLNVVNTASTLCGASSKCISGSCISSTSTTSDTNCLSSSVVMLVLSIVMVVAFVLH